MIVFPKGRRPYGNTGFSLIELLVVISIIGLLTGLVSVAVPRAIRMAKVAKTRAEMTAILSAIKAYQNEYSRLPNPTGDTSGGDVWLAGGDSKNLMKVLTGQDVNGQNPKKVRFLEGPDDSGNFQDPWKKGSDLGQYKVKLDLDGSGTVEYYGDINLTAIVISFGDTGNQESPSTSKTNLFSWK